MQVLRMLFLFNHLDALTYLLIIQYFFKAFRACFIQIIPLIYRFGRNWYHTGITEYHALTASFNMVLAPCNNSL